MTPTGKVAIWGHWIVGLLAAAIAGTSIWGIVGNTVSMDRGARFGAQVLIADSQLAVLGLIATPPALGVITSLSIGEPLVILSMIPDALAAIAITWGWLGAFYFLDEDDAEAKHAQA